MSELTRRHFIALVTCAGAAVCCGATDVLADEKADTSLDGAAPTTLDAGPITGYKTDGITDTFARSHRAFIIREAGRIYAASSVCTHKKQRLRLKDGVISCPSHGSKFSEHGTVIKGPAKYSLPRYAVSTNADGHLVVDLTTTFEEKQWDDKGAFVEG